MRTARIAILPIILTVMLIGCSCAGGPCPDELILDACSGVCSGQAASQATDYTGGTAPHPVVLLSSSGNKHSWTGKISQDWWPVSITDVELVFCVDKEQERVVQTCRYVGGSTLERIQYHLDVELREAKTGDLICGKTLYGSKPWPCPQFKGDLTSDEKGSHVSFEQLEEWFEGFVTTSTSATPCPSPVSSSPHYLGLGESVRVTTVVGMDMIITVNSATRAYSYDYVDEVSGDTYTETAPAGHVFVIIDVLAENVGIVGRGMSDYGFNLRDSADRSYDPITYYGDDKFGVVGHVDLNPGESTRGKIVFEVPEAASGLELVRSFDWWWNETWLVIWQLEW